MRTIIILPVSVATTASDLDRRVGDHLDEDGIRFTPARRLMVRALAAAGGPQGASELHGALRRAVPLSSLYRNLAVLEDAGVVQRYSDPSGTHRYELAEWLTGHHHHLACTGCGVTVDLDVDPETEAMVRSLVAGLATRTGFQVTDHRLDFEGLCPSCRSKS
jgi:Fe2+ or Zn2+ uptake regulation protein